MIAGTPEPGEKDFYAQLMLEIDAGKDHQAVDMIMALDGRSLQIENLSRLAADLDHVLDIRGASTLDLNRARALLRARECASDLAKNLDIDHAHALETAIDRARVLYLYLDRAGQINRIIMDCLNIMDRGNRSSTNMAAVTRLHRRPTKSKRGKAMWIALLCILVLVGVFTVMMLRSQSSANDAATSTTLTVTTDSTQSK